MKSRLEVNIDTQCDNIDDLRSPIDGRFHYFYKIVNNINKKYYFGIHTTDDLFDGYCGSGVILKCVYKKYGKGNCTKHILKFFDDRKSLLDYEKYIVDEDLINSNECYNIIPGGGGSYNTMTPVITLDGESIVVSKTEYKNNKKLYKHPTLGKIRINNGILNKMVDPKLLDKYLNNGWVRGETFKSCLGKILVNYDNIEERFIYESELDEYLKNGWIRGGKSRNKGKKSFAKNLMWINDGHSQKRIPQNQLDHYLNSGWVIGVCQSTTTGYVRITNGVYDKNINPKNIDELEFYLSEGWVRGSCHSTNKDFIWVNNGKDTKCISKNNIDEYLSSGWVRGRLDIDGAYTLGKVAIHKDKKVLMVDPKNLDNYLNNGWKKGNPKSGGNINSGKIRVSKDGITKCILSEDLNTYLNDGWVRGSKKWKTKKIRITNGEVEKMIMESELDDYIKIGYRRGVLVQRRKKTTINP